MRLEGFSVAVDMMEELWSDAVASRMQIDSSRMRHCALEHSINRRGGKEELIHRGHAAPKDFAGFTRSSLASMLSQKEIPEEGNKPIRLTNSLANNNTIVQRMKKSGHKSRLPRAEGLIDATSHQPAFTCQAFYDHSGNVRLPFRHLHVFLRITATLRYYYYSR